MFLKKSKMRNLVKICLIIFAMVMIVSCKDKVDNKVKIGVVIPMTGAGSTTAGYWVNGFSMAIDKLNAENKDVQYEVVYEDSKSDPATSLSCYKRLEMQGVKYVLAIGGQFAMAIAPATKGRDIIYFTSADYNEAVLDATDCAFRVYPSATALGKTASDFLANELGIKKTAAISINTVPCLQAYNAFSENLNKLGGTVVFNDTYDIGAYDFKNTVSKMAEKDFGGIFITGFGISPAAFCSQMASNSKFDNVVLLGDVNLATKSFAENKKNDKVKVYYADTKLNDSFSAEYKKRFGETANSYCGCAYLISNIVDQVRKAVDDPNDIASQRNYLRSKEIQSDAASVSFDNKGNGEMELAIFKLQ